MIFLADQKGYGLNNITFQIGLKKGWIQLDDVEVEKMDEMSDPTWFNNADARIDSLRKVDFMVKANPVRLHRLNHKLQQLKLLKLRLSLLLLNPILKQDQHQRLKHLRVVNLVLLQRQKHLVQENSEHLKQNLQNVLFMVLRIS